jgi:hypothetical protein
MSAIMIRRLCNTIATIANVTKPAIKSIALLVAQNKHLEAISEKDGIASRRPWVKPNLQAEDPLGVHSFSIRI